MEVRDTLLDKAEFHAFEVQDFEIAEKLFRDSYDMTGGASKRMEILFEILLMNFQK